METVRTVQSPSLPQDQKPAHTPGRRRTAPLRVEAVYLGTTPDTLGRQMAALRLVLGR